MRGQYREPKKSRLNSLSKDEIKSNIKSLNSKLSTPLFYSRVQLSEMRKKVRDLEMRLSDILDGEDYQHSLQKLRGGCVDRELESVRQSEQSRKGKSELKAKSRGYRIRPGPKRWEPKPRLIKRVG